MDALHSKTADLSIRVVYVNNLTAHTARWSCRLECAFMREIGCFLRAIAIGCLIQHYVLRELNWSTATFCCIACGAGTSRFTRAIATVWVWVVYGIPRAVKPEDHKSLPVRLCKDVATQKILKSTDYDPESRLSGSSGPVYIAQRKKIILPSTAKATTHVTSVVLSRR